MPYNVLRKTSLRISCYVDFIWQTDRSGTVFFHEEASHQKDVGQHDKYY